MHGGAGDPDAVLERLALGGEPIILQAGVPVHPDDTEESLSARILVEEHRLYPEAIRLFADGRLTLAGRKVLIR